MGLTDKEVINHPENSINKIAALFNKITLTYAFH